LAWAHRVPNQVPHGKFWLIKAASFVLEATEPSKPLSPVVQEDHRGVLVDWVAPKDNGSAILRYQVTVNVLQLEVPETATVTIDGQV
jgi:hypothetical protein